ncbi:glutathione peroxidase [Sphingomonas sp.]|uniref:glutathione peroxidase n=1 Tax=Sphingomonas sp. TaxID=28214 RepID=UPI003F72D0CF
MAGLYDIAVRTIDGHEGTLASYRGKVLLIVNTASKCGLTPQYEGLAALHQAYRAQGFEILGFPSNDFRGQEPGEDAEIAAFCQITYAVDFPLFSKVTVTGPAKHPLYEALIEAAPATTSTSGDSLRWRLINHGIEVNPPPEIQWNFEKFVIGRDGKPVGRFAPDTLPQDQHLIATIEQALRT